MLVRNITYELDIIIFQLHILLSRRAVLRVLAPSKLLDATRPKLIHVLSKYIYYYWHTCIIQLHVLLSKYIYYPNTYIIIDIHVLSNYIYYYYYWHTCIIVVEIHVLLLKHIYYCCRNTCIIVEIQLIIIKSNKSINNNRFIIIKIETYLFR